MNRTQRENLKCLAFVQEEIIKCVAWDLRDIAEDLQGIAPEAAQEIEDHSKALMLALKGRKKS